jgi:hypothetical protein
MRNFSGKYFSTNHFVNVNNLAKERLHVLGKGYRAEGDTTQKHDAEQMQRILDFVSRNEYVVEVEDNSDANTYDWIVVSKVTLKRPENKSIKIVDGFVFLLVTEKAKEVFSSGLFEVYELHEDGSESLLESMDDLNEALEMGLDIAIEGGYMKTEVLQFIDEGSIVTLVLNVEDADFWTTINGYDVHYCEDYNEICVYLDADYTKTIYSRPIKSN